MIVRCLVNDDWSFGPEGQIRCDIEVEALRSDARAGSEADGLAIGVPIGLRIYFDPPPIGQSIALFDQDGEEIVTGVIDSIGVTYGESIRMSIDL